MSRRGGLWPSCCCCCCRSRCCRCRPPWPVTRVEEVAAALEAEDDEESARRRGRSSMRIGASVRVPSDWWDFEYAAALCLFPCLARPPAGRRIKSVGRSLPCFVLLLVTRLSVPVEGGEGGGVYMKQRAFRIWLWVGSACMLLRCAARSNDATTAPSAREKREGEKARRHTQSIDADDRRTERALCLDSVSIPVHSEVVWFD